MSSDTGFSSIPTEAPPPGQITDFDAPTLRSADLGVGIVLSILAGVTMIMSAMVDFKKQRVTIILSMLAFICATTQFALTVQLAASSRHEWDIPISTFSLHTVQVMFAVQCVPMFTMMFAKTAICTFYLSIFKTNRTTRRLIYGAVVFNIVAVLAPGIPVSAIYCAPKIHGDFLYAISVLLNCQKAIVWSPISTTLNTALDLFLFILPIPILARLSMPTRKKLGVIAVFGSAIFGVVASIISMVYRIGLWMNENDKPRVETQLLICWLVESYIAIMVANMVPAAAFWKRILQKTSQTYGKYASQSRSFQSQTQRSSHNIQAKISRAQMSAASAQQLHNQPEIIQIIVDSPPAVPPKAWQ